MIDNVADDDEKDDDVVDVAEDEVEVDDVEDEDDDVEEEGRSQDPDPHFVRACAVEMHLDISQEPLCAKNCWPNVTDQTATQTLSELAQSWTCRQSHSMRQFHKSHFRENLLVKCHGPKPRRSFGRACAIEMHMDMSPEPSHAAIYRENAAPQDRVARFARVCAVEMHLDISQEPLCARIYRKNARTKSATHTLCEPAQLKCAWTFHKSHFTRKFRGKMPGPRWGTLIKHRPLDLP